MRIDDRNAAVGGTAARAADIEQTQATSGKGFNSASRSGGDSVELSGASVAVRSFNAARDAKLQHLAKAVQSGAYSVNPSLVGRALVGETLAQGHSV